MSILIIVISYSLIGIIIGAFTEMVIQDDDPGALAIFSVFWPLVLLVLLVFTLLLVIYKFGELVGELTIKLKSEKGESE